MKLDNGRYDQDELDKNSTIWSLAINDELLEYHQNYSSTKKMTAQEMFEKLGYERKHREYDNVIIYSKYNGDYKVMFDLKDRDYTTNQFVYMKLHRAINQQCKELGWL